MNKPTTKVTSIAILALGSVMLLSSADRAEAQLWTPAQISTAAWYDADDASTITHTTNAVTQWDDKSGNARHARPREIFSVKCEQAGS